MDSNVSTLHVSSLSEAGEGQKDHGAGDSLLQSQFVLQKESSHVPMNFIWPKEDLVKAIEELREPVVDLSGFLKGDLVATQDAAMLIRESCLKHGFFQITGHGVDPRLIQMAYDHLDRFFKLPVSMKLRAKRMPGTNSWGYSGAHADRFSSKLPWKETLSFRFYEPDDSHPVVLDFFKSTLGMDFEETGLVYQKYCAAMKEVALAIMELMAISLGIHDQQHYKHFFQDGSSIMRCNYYPPCKEPEHVFGTGPHCDPTSLTILHQDQVGGLEVFSDNKWRTVPPRQGAFVVNIGDTFMALSNGKYKSCLHRALVNRDKERRSLTFFMNPREDKVVRPPEDLVSSCTGDAPRTYPDFTWSELLQFTQKHYRADDATLPNFTKWLLSSKPANVNNN
ncbi:gibberellin 20 oxidase 2-like [Juglans microcarpa x Juglans regia]|uniref:gibberellin 20 oxidase 2-like n=1 Tax=Juglans microcarpa x Juglans regia TaxID=2249226 RepID=UPI001B7F2573|nr:gibberellin 20 oxidase 2-like [Juglans microcarpa x Juglans regia]